MPETSPLETDPITSQSMSGPILLASLLLVASLAWALYDEFYGLRPWKGYQERFKTLYPAHLKKVYQQQLEAEQRIRDSEAYQKLKQAYDEAIAAVATRERQIKDEQRLVDARLAALTEILPTARGEVSALIYKLETTAGERARGKLRRKIEEVKQGPFRAKVPQADGSLATRSFIYDELNNEYNRLRDRKAELARELSELYAKPNQVQQQMDAYMAEHVVGLRSDIVSRLIQSIENLKVDIRQVHVLSTRNFAVPETDLVDRCQSCHVGMDTRLVPLGLTLTKAALGVANDSNAPFASHPNNDLLKIHDPEKFGCSPCHGGNGRATTSVVKGHGRHKYWLWPLYQRENFEAGCQQCHAKDFVLEHAKVLSQGKQLYRLKGCVGCHRFQGFDDEAEQILSVRQQLLDIDKQKKENELEAVRSEKAGDAAPSNAEAQRLYQRAANLRVTISALDAKREQLERRWEALLHEQKKLGPNLKEVRLKLRREWIPVWLENPHAWRPTTKMPRFRLAPDEIQALSAFIWQSALRAKLASQPRGNPERGKELFETRGCMACHSVGGVGGSFAADLSRLGEKANYDYIVRWIHDPRERTLPYCPTEKRDIGLEDYARKGLPFVFDAENTRCPNDGQLLQVQQMTVMPSLRLTWEEARDIASYLMTLRQQQPSAYPAAAFMEDTSLGERGRFLVRHFGCAGCHEIAGFEEERGIGTELTVEGSKPIERLDFALLTHDAKNEDWYNHKGFFERKLADPASFDQGKVKEPLERLKMPNPNVAQEDITALTTFLLGSVETTIPEHLRFTPADYRADIQAGWPIVTKYNCMGCHQIQLGEPSVLMTLPRYQDPDWKEQVPPSLVGVGARLNPDWLTKFLENPALSKTELNRNGVRTYLHARMPTFYFSPDEIRKLVRFFQALSAQPIPYIPPKLEPLSDRERILARQLFTHPAAPCLKCHATGEPAHDRTATAPNFLMTPERLKPGWTRRWILDPARIMPGTAMPTGLFQQQGDRWVFASPVPESFRGYNRDHADLLVRYMFEITPEEQRLLVGRGGAAAGNASGGSR